MLRGLARRGRLAAGVTVLVALTPAAATLAACTGSTEHGARPVTRTTTPSTAPSTPASTAPHRALCLVPDRQQEFMVQPGTVSPGTGLTLEQADLVAPVNLTVTGAWTVPFNGSAAANGVIMNYPPSHHAGIADGLAEWGDRTDLSQRSLGPADGRQAVLVAVRLTDAGREGHLDGVTLSTSAGPVSWTRPLLVVPHRTMRFCTLTEFDSTLDWVP